MTAVSPFLFRHPELVSGSTGRLPDEERSPWMLKRVQHDATYDAATGSAPIAQRFHQAPAHREVDPVGIFRFDEVDLPGAVPALELLFAGDRSLHGLEELGVDEAVDPVSRGEARRFGSAMLPEACGEVGRDTYIKGAARLAGKNVGARASLSHDRTIAGPWTLKQVQGDGGGPVTP